MPAEKYSISVKLPDGTKTNPPHTALLPHTHITPEARKYHIFRELKDKFFLSMGQLCNANMTSTFIAKNIYINKEEK